MPSWAAQNPHIPTLRNPELGGFDPDELLASVGWLVPKIWCRRIPGFGILRRADSRHAEWQLAHPKQHRLRLSGYLAKGVPSPPGDARMPSAIAYKDVS